MNFFSFNNINFYTRYIFSQPFPILYHKRNYPALQGIHNIPFIAPGSSNSCASDLLSAASCLQLCIIPCNCATCCAVTSTWACLGMCYRVVGMAGRGWGTALSAGRAQLAQANGLNFQFTHRVRQAKAAEGFQERRIHQTSNGGVGALHPLLPLSNCQCKFAMQSPYRATAIECVAFVRLNAKLKFQFDTARSLCELVRGTSHTRLPPTTVLDVF